MTESGARIPPELVRAAQSGDPDAITALVQAAYPLVRRWSLVATGDPMAADDVTQEALVRTVRGLGRFGGRSAFETWLFTTTRNCARDFQRRERRANRFRTGPVIEEEPIAADEPDPLAEIERREARRALHTFIDALPERQRLVFDLVELQGYAASEVAEMLDIAAVSVRAHLFKARRALRTRILQDTPELAKEAR